MWKVFIFWIMFAVSLRYTFGNLLDTSYTFCVNSDALVPELQIVPAAEGDKIELLCQHCSLTQLDQARIPKRPRAWYQKDLNNNESIEVPIIMNTSNESRLIVDQNVLVIKKFNSSIDSLRFECRSTEEKESPALIKIGYLVDALTPSLAIESVVSGDVTALSAFERKRLLPLADLVQKEISASLKMQWGQRSLCQECLTSPGRSHKRGRCTLQTSNSSKFPHNLKTLSCRSALLQPLVSRELSDKLLAVPDFDLVENCSCLKLIAAADLDDSDIHGDIPGLRFFLAEGSTWHIKCPFMEYPGAYVDWYKENTLMNVRTTQPDDAQCSFWCKCGNLYVSPYNHDLTVTFAAPSIEGNYSCQSNNKKWGFELRVYDVTGTCAMTTNSIMLVITLLALLLSVSCCIVSRLTNCSKCCDSDPESVQNEEPQVISNSNGQGANKRILVARVNLPMHAIQQPGAIGTGAQQTAGAQQRGQTSRGTNNYTTDQPPVPSHRIVGANNRPAWRVTPAPTPGSM